MLRWLNKHDIQVEGQETVIRRMEGEVERMNEKEWEGVCVLSEQHPKKDWWTLMETKINSNSLKHRHLLRTTHTHTPYI